MSKNRKHAYSGRGLDMKVKSNLFMPTGWQRRTSKNHEAACDIWKSAREITKYGLAQSRRTCGASGRYREPLPKREPPAAL
jgi:hypothetical protein